MAVIYVYRRQRSISADVAIPDGATLLRAYRVSSRADAKRLRSNPGEHIPARINALLDRLWATLPERAAGMARPIGGRVSYPLR